MLLQKDAQKAGFSVYFARNPRYPHQNTERAEKPDIISDVRRGGRVDDCARLENVFTREGNGGSNPFLSAEQKGDKSCGRNKRS